MEENKLVELMFVTEMPTFLNNCVGIPLYILFFRLSLFHSRFHLCQLRDEIVNLQKETEIARAQIA